MKLSLIWGNVMQMGWCIIKDFIVIQSIEYSVQKTEILQD